MVIKASLSDGDLPDSNSDILILSHPTVDECVTIWEITETAWCDSLTIPLYLEESLFISTIPLAREGGITTRVLVRKN